MSERDRFMEALEQLAAYAREAGNVLTKTEVEESFRGMALSGEQFDLIYRYLFEKRITIQGIPLELPAQDEPDFEPQWMTAGMASEPENGAGEEWEEGRDADENGRRKGADPERRSMRPEDEEDQTEEDKTEEDEAETEEADAAAKSGKTGTAAGDAREDARYLRLYLEELENLPLVTEEDRLALAMRLLAGEEAALEPLLNATLREVVELARSYRGRGVLLEDLIQEGNIGLLQALREMKGKKRQEEPLRYIHEFVQYTMEQYLDEQLAGGEAEERLVAKLGLLHEAAKYLAKENGTLPSARELAEFTKLPEEEIAELVRLSKDVDLIGGEG
ncbi:MAG: hypothetical protein K2N94_06160, partial [Lachnospiraceae bacterium]|nr:hypothetical protein [Lachnospiraceae bacterium]